MATEHSKEKVDNETIKVNGKASNLKESTKNKTPNKSLPCCACGGIALCNCTIKDFNDNQANSADAKSRAAD